MDLNCLAARLLDTTRASGTRHHREWTEMGEALPRGMKDSWDEQSVFTPNILVADGRYWLFYTAVPKPFIANGPKTTKTAIGIAVSDSPNGPWEKLASNPALKVSDNPDDFDSLRVDDTCLIVREGKYWLYYKSRQSDRSPRETKKGVAVADKPAGPYVKHSGSVDATSDIKSIQLAQIVSAATEAANQFCQGAVGSFHCCTSLQDVIDRSEIRPNLQKTPPPAKVID